MSDFELYCPQCGDDAEQLYEGYCQDCSEENNNQLFEHNFHFDRWEALTEKEREAEIRKATQ